MKNGDQVQLRVYPINGDPCWATGIIQRIWLDDDMDEDYIVMRYEIEYKCPVDRKIYKTTRRESGISLTMIDLTELLTI